MPVSRVSFSGLTSILVDGTRCLNTRSISRPRRKSDTRPSVLIPPLASRVISTFAGTSTHISTQPDFQRSSSPFAPAKGAVALAKEHRCNKPPRCLHKYHRNPGTFPEVYCIHTSRQSLPIIHLFSWHIQAPRSQNSANSFPAPSPLRPRRACLGGARFANQKAMFCTPNTAPPGQVERWRVGLPSRVLVARQRSGGASPPVAEADRLKT